MQNLKFVHWNYIPYHLLSIARWKYFWIRVYASQVPPSMTASTDISLGWIRLTVRSTSRASVITSHNLQWLPLHLQCSTLPNNMKYIVPNGVNKRPASEITNWITCLLLLISMLWHRQAIFESKGDKLSSSAECRVRTWKSQDTYSPADWMPTHKPTELSRIKLKTWTQQPVLMMSEHSDHLTSLPSGFRTWLWRYTCLLLLISMLWHRQAVFESKGNKLSVGTSYPTGLTSARPEKSQI